MEALSLTDNPANHVNSERVATRTRMRTVLSAAPLPLGGGAAVLLTHQ